VTDSPMPKPAPADEEKPHGDVLDGKDEQGPGVGAGGGATVDDEPNTFEPEEDPK
jgi:hypothetical protein